MKIIITGPTGAIGMALMVQCIEQKHEVLAICHKGSKRIGQIPQNNLIKALELDLSDYGDYTEKILAGEKNAMQGNSQVQEPNQVQASAQIQTTAKYDVMIHLAWDGAFGNARNNMELQENNVRYTLDAVRMAKALGCQTFIGAGSQAEYGRVEGVLRPDTPTNPENGYGIAKLDASFKTRDLCHELGMKHIWTRILSIYGPYDGEKTMISSEIIKLLKGETPQFTKGEQMWDYLYCEDVARAILLLAEKGCDGKIYPLGSGVARPLAEYILTIRDLIDPKAFVQLGAIPYGEKQVMHLEADISQLEKDTGFRPQVAFIDGAKQTIQYWKTKNITNC